MGDAILYCSSICSLLFLFLFRRAGAINAALLAASVLALADDALAARLEAWRRRQTEAVAEAPADEAAT